MAITDEEREKAQRLARAIVSDIALYHEADVLRGIREDNLFDVLKEPIEEGRELYRGRISRELDAETNYFDRALCDLLLRGKGHLPSKLW